MPSLYKKPIFGVDPVTGKKIKEKSKKWWGRYRDESGIEPGQKRLLLSELALAAFDQIRDVPFASHPQRSRD